MNLSSTSERAVVVVACVVWAGCGASTPIETTPAHTEQPVASDTAPNVETEPPAPAPAPRVAADSAAEGLEPLDAAERATLEAADCRAQVQQIAASTVGPRGNAGHGVVGGATRLIGSLIAARPQTPCLALAVRDTRVYRARTIESEAIAALRSVARAMTDAGEERTTLCPSAPPMPADLDALREGPVTVDSAALRGGPWECAMPVFFGDPVRFQYEIRTAPDGSQSEIIARGFPVADRPRPEELFVRVVVGDDATPVVYRR